MNDSNILIMAAGLLFLGVAFVVARLMRLAGHRSTEFYFGGTLVVIALLQLLLSGGWASLINLAVISALFAGVLLVGLLRLEKSLEHGRWLNETCRQDWAEAERELQEQRDALARANEEWPKAYANLERATKELESNAIQAKVRAVELARANAQLKSDHERLAAENERLSIAAEQLQQIVAALDEDIFEQKRAQQEVQGGHAEILTVVPIAETIPTSARASDWTRDAGRPLNEISASLAQMAEHLAESRVTNVSRIARLLREHARNLSAFLTRDSRGKPLPESLAVLAQQLSNEHALLVRKVGAIRRNVEQLKALAAESRHVGRDSRASVDLEGAAAGYTLSAAATETGTQVDTASAEPVDSPETLHNP